MFPLPLHIYFETAALLASILLWRSLKNTGLRWFLPFLLLIVIAELSGRFMYKELKQPNAWLYNLTVPLEYLFYGTIFLFYYTKKINQIIAKLFLFLFILYAIISLIITNGIYIFNENFLLVGSFSMVLFCLLFLFEQYNNLEEKSIWQIPMFWVTIGIFLFNVGEFSYNFLSRYLIGNDMDPSLKFFRSINNKLILVLYSSFIIAFICQKISGTSRKA
jgi:hypothetical protein